MVKKYVAGLTVFRAQDVRKMGAFLETALASSTTGGASPVSPSWVISAPRAALRRLRSKTRLRVQSRAHPSPARGMHHP